MQPSGNTLNPSPPADVEAGGKPDFECLRPRLFGVASRILGGTADAEDVVQDVWIRWHQTDRTRVRDRTGFLVTATTRVALNIATSARARREISVGDRMPEPRHAVDDPAADAERKEDLELAVLLLMERLSPVERAVFILREAFEYPFGTIAESVGVTEPNARQLARRARLRLDGPRRAHVDPVEHERQLSALLVAARRGEVARLERMLIDTIRRPDVA